MISLIIYSFNFLPVFERVSESMYAVIRSGGKQYRVSPGDLLRVEKLPGEVGNLFTFEEILMVGGNGPDELRIGTPLLEGVQVIGKIEKQDRAKKITVFKFKRRKKYRKKQGHRQSFTALRIQEIKV